MSRAPTLLIQSEMAKCRRRDYIQACKTAFIVVCILALCALPQFRALVVGQTLLLFLLVVISFSIFATIPCTKIIGFCASFICFIGVFVLAIYQDDFCLRLKTCEDIKVSLAIVLTFLVGLICYFVTVMCFFCSRDMSREVYRG